LDRMWIIFHTVEHAIPPLPLKRRGFLANFC